MISIPSTYYGDRTLIDLETGTHKLANEVGMNAINGIIDGMLFHNGTLMLSTCETPEQRFMCQARAQILREMQGYLHIRLQEKEILESNEETSDVHNG